MDYIAHIRESDKEEQTLRQHLLESKEFCEKEGEKLGLRKVAGLAGLLHDLGKATPEFFNYLNDAVYHPEKKVKRGSVDHSTAGGRLLFTRYYKNEKEHFKKLLVEVVANAIISHHGYLTDYLNFDLESEFLNRVQEKELPSFAGSVDYFFDKVMGQVEFDCYVEEATFELANFMLKINGSDFYETEKTTAITYLTKVVFSILIDADRTNTRLFEENSQEDSELDVQSLFLDYQKNLDAKIASFGEVETASPINQLRAKMSDETFEYAEKESGIYTLSIPTGGGKTLASFRYALAHALKHKKKRIIYVVPYVTIIEQNAQEVRNIIQDDEHLLEHHSNVLFFDEEEKDEDTVYEAGETLKKNLRLAKDNWDSPIIFTSMVQFLNIFYASGTQNIRRLHNLSDAVIIFDEVQKVPTHCISLFNHAVNYLNQMMGASIILCTATQPALGELKYQLNISENSEIISDLETVEKAFERVELIDKTQFSMNTEMLSDFIIQNEETFKSQLIILNTKKTVLELYLLLKQRVNNVHLYHLSTLMCAAHRKIILEEIRGKLENKEKVICISTPLIEAGVDISFESVIRSLAGLDSIAQAAGRCNRHGELAKGYVCLIHHNEEKLDRLSEIKEGGNITKQLLNDITIVKEDTVNDLLTKKYMRRYFKQYYDFFKAQLDYPIEETSLSHVDLLSNQREAGSLFNTYIGKHNKQNPLISSSSLKTAAQKFEVIKNQTKSVLVPYGEGKDIEIQLNSEENIPDLSEIIKKAQAYSINVYNYELDKLESEGAITVFKEDIILILKEAYYDTEYGLQMEGTAGFSMSMF